MPYSQFTIDVISETFGFSISERIGIFTDVRKVDYSTLLAQMLKEYIPLAVAIGTEKARSEFIIAPILFELKKQLVNRISLFSGKEFNVAPEQGLSGFCDFLISLSPEQLFIQAPVVTIVEAKNDNIQSGLGQCIAEMIAAKLFNERKENKIEIIYGVVTTGSIWKFMRLIEQRIEVDLDEYFIQDIGKILGILRSFVDV
ncbi:hypothetical protein H6G81_16265 [Scytonema hofmannii FACHB-248]|uniref:Uncharacterized protein n=1 Tax=Scytonema hofmannii FACHB-248 TaxID=1842502 RepID=A0ABR8GS54_9CYAN|nr:MULTISPECIES: hypothetical protein [Nostocales]MBD2606037.1 hypothetical protein [Scytonema hofmannii FACHB-248]